jgi:hypothetical protein
VVTCSFYDFHKGFSMTHELGLPINLFFCFKAVSCWEPFWNETIFSWTCHHFFWLNHQGLIMALFLFWKNPKFFNVWRFYILSFLKVDAISLLLRPFMLHRSIQLDHILMRLGAEADCFIIIECDFSWSKDIISLLIVFELKIQIFNDFIRCLYFFVIDCNLLV